MENFKKRVECSLLGTLELCYIEKVIETNQQKRKTIPLYIELHFSSCYNYSPYQLDLSVVISVICINSQLFTTQLWFFQNYKSEIMDGNRDCFKYFHLFPSMV